MADILWAKFIFYAWFSVAILSQHGLLVLSFDIG